MNNFYSIAPMMGKTDSFFCYLMQLINKNIYIYTEMIHAEVINRTNVLENYKVFEDLSNIGIQIAGNSPSSLALAAKKAARFGFSEINLNCGCPSKNVMAGDFGLSLLLNPKLVKTCVNSIKDVVDCEVSVKTRIGINYDNDQTLLNTFVETVNLSGIKKYILHARNGIIGNLSTKKNLTIPELRYEVVFNLKKNFSKNFFIINGGFLDTNNFNKYYKKIDGIMIGREAYKNPWIFYKKNNISLDNKIKIILKYIEHIKKLFEKHQFNNKSLHHIQNAFNGHAGAKKWREIVNISIHNNDLQYLVNFIDYTKFGEIIDY